ncbi:MAG: hypothetical protein ACI9JN_000376 [Bacteroidia bacterium]|jgi:hypothetical protein
MSNIRLAAYLKFTLSIFLLSTVFLVTNAQNNVHVTVNSDSSDYRIIVSTSNLATQYYSCERTGTGIFAYNKTKGGGDLLFKQQISGAPSGSIYEDLTGPSVNKTYYISTAYTGKNHRLAGIGCKSKETSPRFHVSTGYTDTTASIKKPKNVTASDEAHDTYIDIEWEKGTDIPDNLHKYKIYRGDTLIKTVDGDVRTYRDNGLDPGKTYRYFVTTFTDDFGTGDHESPKDTVVASDEGSTFSMGLSATDTEFTSRTLLRWNDVSTIADEIEINRIDGVDTIQLDVVSKYSKSFSDYDGIPGYTYTYMVRPVKTGIDFEPDFDDGARKENGRIKGKVVSTLNAGVFGVVVYAEATIDENGSTITKTYTDTTDASGYYELTDLYYYKKGEFKIYPGKPKHAFKSDTIVRNLDIDNPKLAGVDFTDTTVFTIAGNIGYPIVSGAATVSCGVQGAIILLNGNQITQTDAVGDYAFVVQDEGTYNIRAQYLHHQFNVSDTNLFVEDNVLGLDFIDIETDTLKIKVQGGCNSSFADWIEVRVRSTQDVHCFDSTIYTNASGNAEIILPSQEYKVEVTDIFPVNSNIFHQIGDKPITIDLTVRDSLTLYDTTYAIDTIASDTLYVNGIPDIIPGYFDTTAVTYDSSSLAMLPKTDFIYLSDISISINWEDAADKMVWLLNDTVPLMEKGGSYGITIKVEEESSGCPVKEGELRIYDYISDRDNKAQILPIVNGRVEYEVVAGNPMIAGGGTHPNQKLFYMFANVGFLDPLEYEQWVLVTGAQARDQTFVTRSAGIPFVVLHDPPGDQSYSYVEKGAEFSSFIRTESVTAGSTGFSGELKVGGGIITLATSAKQGAAVDLEIVSGYDSAKNVGTETTVTFNERFTTSDAELMTGYPGDVFVGAAFNMVTSLADAIYYDETARTITRDTILFMDPVGFATTFIYTEDFITTVLIPNLEEIKKLTTNTDSAAALQLDINNWNGMLADNAINRDEKAEKVTDGGFSNISISSGTSYENEYSYDTTISGSYEYETFINADLFLGVAGESVTGAWVEFKAGIVTNVKQSYTNAGGTDNTSSRVVGYHIEDNDRGDYHSIDLLNDVANGVPAFRLVSGATSCPHEPNTQRRYLGEIDVYPRERNNVPTEGEANFIVSLTNNSQSDETQTYEIQVLQESNLDGAIIRLAGTSINHSPVSYTLPPGQIVEVKLTVERGPLASSYKDLKLRIAAGCEVDGLFTLVSADTVSFDVGYQSDCSTVGIYRPVENWIMNSTHGDYLDMAFTNYDANDPNLESLILEYRKEGKGWEEAVEIPKDSLIQKFYDVKVLTKNWTDGLYQLRAMANCRSTISQVQYSDIVNGKIDRSPAALFGEPFPSDGILNVGDDIMVEFDQYIDKTISYLPGKFALQRDDDKTFLPIAYSINEGKLIITTKPTSLLDSLEGVKINAIVSQIEDLSGNVLTDPITWSFIVNRSPVYWTKRNVSYSMERGDLGSFEADLTNVGGANATYTIDSYPDWLIPNPLAGSIAGLGGTQKVTFGIKPGLFPGTYSDTVVANSGSYKLLLLVQVEVLATAPKWVTTMLDASQFKYNMNAILQFSTSSNDNPLSTDVQDVIGVFNGNKLVGKASIEYVPALRRHLAFVTIYSHSVDSDSLLFRIWDAKPGIQYLAKETTLFKNNALLGQTQSPYILHPNGVFQTLHLESGWNWFSLFVNTSSSTPDQLFSDLTKDSLTVIKNRDVYSQYDVTGWSNEITDLTEGLGYMINVPQNDTIELYGTLVEDGTIQVDGNDDWTWIGTGDILGSSIGDKTKDLKQTQGDIIKSQQAFAVYDETTKSWLGSLNYLEPGDGYKIKTTIPGSLKTKKMFKTLPPWNLDYNGLEYNMNVTAELVKNSKRIFDSHYLIGAFVDGKCQGVGQPKYSETLGRFIVYLTAFGDTSIVGKALELKLYDTDLGVEVSAAHTAIQFTTDGITGTIQTPLEIDLGNVGVNETLLPADQMICYPNPFEHSFNILLSAQNEVTTIYLTDLTGRIVKHIYQGTSTIPGVLTISTENLVSGLYFCVADFDGKRVSQKVIKE